MKFSVTKEKLLEGLQQVQNVVSTRTTLPILSNVLLQATDGEVHLTTTNLISGVGGGFEEEGEREGVTTFPQGRLFKISVSWLPGKSRSISIEKIAPPFGA